MDKIQPVKTTITLKSQIQMSVICDPSSMTRHKHIESCNFDMEFGIGIWSFDMRIMKRNVCSLCRLCRGNSQSFQFLFLLCFKVFPMISEFEIITRRIVVIFSDFCMRYNMTNIDLLKVSRRDHLLRINSVPCVAYVPLRKGPKQLSIGNKAI